MKILLKDLETGEEETYTIVGTTEADPFKNRISNEYLLKNFMTKTNSV